MAELESFMGGAGAISNISLKKSIIMLVLTQIVGASYGEGGQLQGAKKKKKNKIKINFINLCREIQL